MDVNDFNSVYFIERYINKTSSYIQVKRNVTADYTVNGNYGAKDGTYALTAGTNGVPNDPDLMSEIIVGDSFELTGMQLLMDKELVSVDIIAVPGVSSPSVIAAMQSVCDKRQDCMFIVDPPYGLRATEVEMWSLGAHALNSATFDTDRGALYWPWIKMYDIYANDELELPPSGSICAVYAQNDSIGKPWTAPAGEKRGQMDWITGLCHRATSDERDQLYGGSNCINVISQFTGQSAVVWGQKTMQRSKSAFDRVNVRRLFDYVAKEIKKISRPYIFEPHTMFTRNSYKSALENMLGQVLSGQGVSEYKVICDETINTPETIDRNELRCLIAIKPVKAIEFVYVTVTANRTDVSFEILEQ
jgi:phage tail sheath protein FI